MSEGPNFTVAVPTMNGARHLAATLQSILAQQGGVKFDLLVVDDRSDDGTPELARAVAGDRARVVVNSDRLGLAGNWDRCVALGRTPVVAVVHQDDLWRPGHLAAHASAFAADPGLGLVASASGVVDDAGAAVAESVVGRGGLGLTDRTFAAGEAVLPMAPANPLRCSAVSIRAEAHRDLGGFDPAYGYAVDWEFWLRLARTWPVAWLAATTADVRWHPASETHRFATGTADLDESARVFAATLEWLSGRGESTRAVARSGRRNLSRAYLNRAYTAARRGAAPLARRGLRESLRLWPGVVRLIAADPRLFARLAAAWLPRARRADSG